MKQTNRSRWQKQRHPLELNPFDAYENAHIQEKAMKRTDRLKGMQVKQTWKIKHFNIQHPKYDIIQKRQNQNNYP